MQNQVNLTNREEEREMLPLCENDGIGVIPWSPLAGGKVTRPWGSKTDRSTADMFDKSMYDETEATDHEVVNAVEKVAKARGTSMAEVATAWVLQKSAVTAPIVGVSNLAHVTVAFTSVEIKLSAEEVAALESPYRTRSKSGF